MPGCVFRDIWLEKEEFKGWLTKDSANKHNAKCAVCHKSFSVESMGEQAVKSHGNGVKHLAAIQKRSSNEGYYVLFSLFVNCYCFEVLNINVQ